MALTVETGTTLLYTAVTGCKSKRILMTFVALIYLALLIALANLELQRSAPIRLVTLLSLALPAAAVILVINSAFDLAEVTSGTEPQQLALFFLPIGFAASALIIALTVSDRPLRGIARLIRMVSAFEVTFFDQQNRLHRLAAALLILALLALTWQTTSGNLALVASGLSDNNDALSQLVVNTLINTSAALLGIGFLIRRDWRETLIRLGLRQPQRRECLAGATMALGLFFLVTMATSVWQSLVSPSTFEAQTRASQQIFAAYNSSLALGLLLSLSAGFSEEILFRGALQPVFGSLITSLLFVAIHLQYAFTPAVLILFVVSLALGWLRTKYGTTASIIAHSLYNLIPFLIYA